GRRGPGGGPRVARPCVVEGPFLSLDVTDRDERERHQPDESDLLAKREGAALEHERLVEITPGLGETCQVPAGIGQRRAVADLLRERAALPVPCAGLLRLALLLEGQPEEERLLRYPGPVAQIAVERPCLLEESSRGLEVLRVAPEQHPVAEETLRMQRPGLGVAHAGAP